MPIFVRFASMSLGTATQEVAAVPGCSRHVQGPGRGQKVVRRDGGQTDACGGAATTPCSLWCLRCSLSSLALSCVRLKWSVLRRLLSRCSTSQRCNVCHMPLPDTAHGCISKPLRFSLSRDLRPPPAALIVALCLTASTAHMSRQPWLPAKLPQRPPRRPKRALEALGGDCSF